MRDPLVATAMEKMPRPWQAAQTTPLSESWYTLLAVLHATPSSKYVTYDAADC